MKKILSLALCLLLLLSAVLLAGCGKKTDEEAVDDMAEDASKSAMTLTMYVVTDEQTTDEAKQLVSDEINKLTKAEFKTQLKLIFLTEDEYYATLDDLLAQNEEQARKAAEAKKNKGKSTGTDTETESETESETLATETNEYGVTVTRYPNVSDTQVDILFLGTLGSDKGYDKYQEYITNGWLSGLTGELSGSSKKLRSYVSSSLLSAASYNGTVYGIPNNSTIGQYTYMLVDKELYDSLYYTAEISSVKTIMDLKDFLYDVKQYRPEVLPINATYEYCMGDLAYYWDIAVSDYGDESVVEGVTHHSYNVTGDFSVIGYAYKDLSTISRGKTVLEFNSLFTDKTYVENFLTLAEYKFSNYFGEPAEGQKAAVSFVTGDQSLKESYSDDYYVVTVGYPKVSEEDVYGNMFAVSAYTSNLSRSMDIITYLNTDSTFRNLLQYGVQGKHYSLDSEGRLERLNHDYMMNIKQTGNCFIAYPEEGMADDVWDIAKEQNRVAVLNPLYGFSFDKELKWVDPVIDEKDPEKSEKYGTYQALDETLIKAISDLSVKTWNQLQACEDYDSLETLVKSLQKTLTKTSNANIKKITDSSFTDETPVETDDESNPIETETEEKDIETDKDGNEIIRQTINYYTPYVIYYNWLKTYGYLPADYATAP